MSYNFNAEKTKDELIAWIRGWFDQNGKGCNAVIGISGGKDSSIAAALCVEALGKDRVIGVMMPNLHQADFDDSIALVECLGIPSRVVPITAPIADILNQLQESDVEISTQAAVNLPARIRMSVLYAVSQSMNGRVVNTCNLSEDWIGYSTRWGDSVGDLCPLACLTVTEVKEIGMLLGLPEHLVQKTPSDGLCGKTDEENFGFTYDELDRYIRTGQCQSQIVKNKIDRKHRANRFKLSMPPRFDPNLQVAMWRHRDETKLV